MARRRGAGRASCHARRDGAPRARQRMRRGGRRYRPEKVGPAARKARRGRGRCGGGAPIRSRPAGEFHPDGFRGAHASRVPRKKTAERWSGERRERNPSAGTATGLVPRRGIPRWCGAHPSTALRVKGPVCRAVIQRTRPWRPGSPECSTDQRLGGGASTDRRGTSAPHLKSESRIRPTRTRPFPL